MRILLGTNALLSLGGTEMWTRTMYDALSRDHEVHVFAREGNTVFPELPSYDPLKRYDLALVNHNETLRALRQARLRRIIMTLHGVRPWQEWPVLGADAYVSVSEWVADFVPVSSTVIRNPIQVDRFKPTDPISETPRRVAMISNHPSLARDRAIEACNILGAEFRTAGRMDGQGTTTTPETLMNWADIVIGVGRTALEGLACGRNVYILGSWGAGGMITEDNFEEAGRTNWNGARPGAWPTPQQLAQQLAELYDPNRNLRPRIVAGHSPDTIAQHYVELARSIARGRRLATRLIHRLPKKAMSISAMTLLDPLLREIRRKKAPDGRPGVLDPLWRSSW